MYCIRIQQQVLEELDLNGAIKRLIALRYKLMESRREKYLHVTEESYLFSYIDKYENMNIEYIDIVRRKWTHVCDSNTPYAMMRSIAA